MKNAQILIIVSRFNEMITKCLLDGAKETALQTGLTEKQLKVVWVPGAFEIPTVASKAASSKKYDAIVCIGCVIRGETPHFDLVAGESAAGLMRVSVESQIPVINGIITTNTVEQALNRSGLKMGNKGREAMAAAIEMIEQLKNI